MPPRTSDRIEHQPAKHETQRGEQLSQHVQDLSRGQHVSPGRDSGQNSHPEGSGAHQMLHGFSIETGADGKSKSGTGKGNADKTPAAAAGKHDGTQHIDKRITEKHLNSAPENALSGRQSPHQ